mmetsp:Transcript_135/g.204  ORF Transcript_135/g.204 Transcript_135/m.204 type:complete len:88 (-) Transcript_135:289-552(-)
MMGMSGRREWLFWISEDTSTSPSKESKCSGFLRDAAQAVEVVEVEDAVEGASITVDVVRHEDEGELEGSAVRLPRALLEAPDKVLSL